MSENKTPFDEENPISKQLMSFTEAVRKRPGMYIGATGRQGVLSCLGLVIDALCEVLTKPVDETKFMHSDDRRRRFNDHALLYVFGKGNEFTVSVNCGRKDLANPADLKKRFNVDNDAGLPKPRSADLNIRILRALSDEFYMDCYFENKTEKIIGNKGEILREDYDYKWDTRLNAHFKISSQIFTQNISDDMLHGYVFGVSQMWCGLCLEKVEYAA